MGAAPHVTVDFRAVDSAIASVQSGKGREKCQGVTPTVVICRVCRGKGWLYVVRGASRRGTEHPCVVCHGRGMVEDSRL